MKSTYSISSNVKELETDSEAISKKGFDLIDIKYANGVWFSAYGKNVGKANTIINDDTTWKGEPTFAGFQAQIEDRREDGYELTDVEYDDGYWVGIFSSNEGDSELIVAEDGDDFEAQLLELQDLDSSFSLEYQVLDIEYADGLWVGVANRTSGDATYTFSEDYENFELEVQQQREDGLELTNVEYVDGTWYSVFSELSGLSAYSPETHADIDDFTDEILDYRSKGFDLVNIESVDNEWFGVYKENVDGTDDIITPSDIFDSPADVVIQRQIIPQYL